MVPKLTDKPQSKPHEAVTPWWMVVAGHCLFIRLPVC